MTEALQSSIIQVIAAGIGSIGFGIFFKTKVKQIPWAWLGGTLTWIIYLVVEHYVGGVFIPNFLASIFAGFFAERMAVVNKAPATIFLIAAAIPLIPGGPLYYTMAGLVTANDSLANSSGNIAITVALAISLGFMVAAIVHRYIRLIKAYYVRK